MKIPTNHQWAVLRLMIICFLTGFLANDLSMEYAGGKAELILIFGIAAISQFYKLWNRPVQE